jgi:hypothetical protein
VLVLGTLGSVCALAAFLASSSRTTSAFSDALYESSSRGTCKDEGQKSSWGKLPNQYLVGALIERGQSSIGLWWSYALEVNLIDGTYELFRHYYALPSAQDATGREVVAVRGVLASVLGMIKDGGTHIAVATDHVIESFRNDLWPGYKTSEGVESDLLVQFPLLEEVLSAAGVVVWPMVEFEADDALAAAAIAAARDRHVERVITCTPDKDLAQCVQGSRIVVAMWRNYAGTVPQPPSTPLRGV